MTERKRRLRTGATLAILAVLALLALWCDINAGYRSISLEELGQILSGTASQSLTYTLVDLRLPRVLTSLLVGVGLSLSGCLLQGVSRNDMADPGVLGINAGAGLLVAAFIVFVPAGIFPSAVALPLLAFAGSAAVAFLGWRLSVVRGASSPRRLLLIGVALATGLSSATSLLMLRMSDGDYAFVQNWLAGSIWGASWENVALLAVGLAVLTAGAFYASRTLNVLGLGPAAATGLGVNIHTGQRHARVLLQREADLVDEVAGNRGYVGAVFHDDVQIDVHALFQRADHHAAAQARGGQDLGDAVGGVGHLQRGVRPALTQNGHIGAGNHTPLGIDYAEAAVRNIPQLNNDTLKNAVGHIYSHSLVSCINAHSTKTHYYYTQLLRTLQVSFDILLQNLLCFLDNIPRFTGKRSLHSLFLPAK